MSAATPDYVEIARRMLTHDTSDVGTAAGCAVAVASVHNKLYQRTVPLIGTAGTGALFARSVRVTSAAFPRLAEVNSSDFGDSALIAEVVGRLEQGVALAAATAFYANFLGLTSTLIGEHLVLLVLQRAFPQIDVTAKQESD